MALNKSIQTPYGIAASYWKIGNITEDYVNLNMQITMLGYVSQEARLAGKAPIISKCEVIDGEEYEADDSREGLYTLLKSREDWTNATDC